MLVGNHALAVLTRHCWRVQAHRLNKMYICAIVLDPFVHHELLHVCLYAQTILWLCLYLTHVDVSVILTSISS